MSPSSLRVGFLINPIAGMGGRVGLHGTDGALLTRAQERGALSHSPQRARITLENLSPADLSFLEFVAPTGVMGGDLLDQLRIPYKKVSALISQESSSADTKKVVEEFLSLGLDLILFAGGDGTARDIFALVKDRVPILGIPSGVKMRSGVFGLNPSDVTEILTRLLSQSERRYAAAEILDLGIGALEYSSSEFFGVAKTPYAPDLIQRSKTTHATTSEAGLQELAHHYAKNLRAGTLYLVGPGGSTHLILEALLAESGKNLDAAGVHAIVDGRLLGEDLSEQEILDLLAKYPNSELVVGVIGGQGYLFGRGNQQLSAAVIDAIGWERIFVLASAAKLMELMPVQLHVDFTEPLSSLPPTFIKVHTSVSRSVVCRLLNRVASPDK